ncbi:unnamed protein product [Staurois parvus]|uniref:Uncharacterized protein n=1 Tax=Staurois parvus TaxID=386267 RepID=A0ABN9DEU1_9NEOB|nr:unnamed protein product [Staurois parvus]
MCWECSTRGKGGVCFTVSPLIRMAVLCTDIPSSVLELTATGRKTVCKVIVDTPVGDTWRSPGVGE